MTLSLFGGRRVFSDAQNNRCVTLETLEPRQLFSESASAQITLTSTTGSGASAVYNYDVTVTDTGSTNVGTFWFAWIPGEDFLPSTPSAKASPSGWTSEFTGAGNASDGTAIQWVAGSTAAISPGQSLGGFTFSTADSPAVLAANSPSHSAKPATTSVVYAGAPLSDAGFELVAAVPAGSTTAPTATSTTLASSAASATAGENVTFTATVAPATATGSVTFSDNGATIGSASVGSDGTAAFASSTLPAGSDVITAVYGGDSTFAGSTSASVIETIAAAGPVESATAQLTLESIAGTPAAPVYNYDLTLTNTGTTTVGTFWYAWVPGENFLPTRPEATSSPSGWGNAAGTAGTADITGPESDPDGFALRWVAATASSDIAPGDSLSGFRFSSTDAPAALAGDSPTHPTTPVGTSTVYTGRPFSDAGVQIVAAPVAAVGALQPEIGASKIPSNVQPGEAVNVKVPVTVTNFSAAPSKSKATVTLYAAPDGALDGTQTALTTVTRHQLPVAARRPRRRPACGAQTADVACRRFVHTGDRGDRRERHHAGQHDRLVAHRRAARRDLDGDLRQPGGVGKSHGR